MFGDFPQPPIVVKAQTSFPQPPAPPALSPVKEFKFEPKVFSGYPVRHASANWYIKDRRGRATIQPDVSHLSGGEHGNKFPLDWLKSLSQQDLLNLHSDDHEGVVDWSLVPGRNPTAQPNKVTRPKSTVTYTPMVISQSYCPPGGA